jgi:hypothetical protein
MPVALKSEDEWSRTVQGSTCTRENIYLPFHIETPQFPRFCFGTFT